MAALVADQGEPFFILKILPVPMHAAGMQHYQRVWPVPKDRAADPFPTLGPAPAIVAVTGENPDNRVRAPARNQVTRQHNRLVFGQGETGVYLRIRATANRPKKDRHA